MIHIKNPTARHAMLPPFTRVLAALLICTLSQPKTRAAPPEKDSFDQRVKPFLTKHCLECHSGAKPKGDFHIDKISQDFANEAAREHWSKVLKKIKAGEMPPESKPRPEPKDVEALTNWFSGQLSSAEAARRVTEGRVVLRRLNRNEYVNTVSDLFGIPVSVKESLPADSSANGFDNAAEALHLSSFLLERYLDAADAVLNVAIASAPQPKSTTKLHTFQNERPIKQSQEKVYRISGDTVVAFSSSQWNAVTLWQFYPPDRGKYRFRISVSGVQSASKPVVFRVETVPPSVGVKSRLLGYFDAQPDKRTTIELVEYLEPRTTIRILPYGLAHANEVNKIGADDYKGPGLAIHSIAVEGPINDTWPPLSHRRIFGDLPQSTIAGKLEVVSKDPLADAQRILREFAQRAFRRPVNDDEIKPFAALVRAKLDEKWSFEQSVRVGLMGILVSPNFLFLQEKPGKLDDLALASRLSYFLWSSLPDEDLLKLAGAKKLSDPTTLKQQVERMLKDPKSSAFTENFVGQWLNLRDIDFTEPSHILYPEFDEMLKVSMVKEPQLFFEEVLKNDLSIMNFVASDFSMLNGRLAKHYNIPGVEGWGFRKITLPADSHRGGFMTMAGVLKVTANGTSTSPVVRGAWVLDRIQGTPPPRPPAGVPALEPDIRGATTIREQLAKHRQIASCAGCHSKIDPPGFALESFDVIGGWRENYRSTGNGQPVTINGKRMPYASGKKVDPADVLADGQKFRDIDEFKQLLLKDKDQIARSLTVKVLTYATGAAPGASDRDEVEAIVAAAKAKDYGFRTLVHEIVKSKLFQSK